MERVISEGHYFTQERISCEKAAAGGKNSKGKVEDSPCSNLKRVL